ncbi:hypothetical protein ACEPAG_1575 [Sanghuangporus baumii]
MRLVGTCKPVVTCELEEDKSKTNQDRNPELSSIDTSAPPISIPTERRVVLACATAPSMSSQARTHLDTGLESIPGVSALDLPSSDVPEIRSGFDNNTWSKSSFQEHRRTTHGAIFAEPAGYRSFEALSGNMKPVAPSERPRYDRNIITTKNTEGWKFRPLETYELFRDRNIGAWKHFIHPEGIPYYLNESSLGFSFLTEADLREHLVFEEVKSFMNHLEARIENFDWEDGRPENVEVVLEIQGGWSYYMIDLDKAVVFWIDEYDTSSAFGYYFGVGSHDDFLRQLELEYWVHIEQFPNHRGVGLERFNEALGVLNYWRIDAISSADSTTPYDEHDLTSLADALRNLEGTMKEGHNRAYAVTSLARVMSVFAHERHYNLHGSPGARLQVWQSVREQRKEGRLWLVKYMSPLFFYSPETHLSELERQWVDGVFQERRWKKYQMRLERSWESFVVAATVLLNANIGLLTTPIIFSENNGALFTSPAAVASQVSIVASIASIVVGLLLIRQVYVSGRDIDFSSTKAADYLSRRRHAQLGLETMAIQFSLPFAFLMWAMIAFFISVAISSFFQVDGWPSPGIQSIYAIIWLFIAILIAWTLVTRWEMNNHTSVTDVVSYTAGQSMMKLWTWLVYRKSHSKREASEPINLESITVTSPESDTASPGEPGTSVANK